MRGKRAPAGVAIETPDLDGGCRTNPLARRCAAISGLFRNRASTRARPTLIHKPTAASPRPEHGYAPAPWLFREGFVRQPPRDPRATANQPPAPAPLGAERKPGRRRLSRPKSSLRTSPAGCPSRSQIARSGSMSKATLDSRLISRFKASHFDIDNCSDAPAIPETGGQGRRISLA
jgi:hypothetical protein